VELDAFTSQLGRTQGRVTSPGGAAVLVLGDLQARQVAQLTPGDFVQAEQDVDLTDERIIRTRGSLRVPDGLPNAAAWEVSLCVDGVKRATLRARGGETKSVDDLAINVVMERGVHTVAVRLELVDESA
jgi:hypothetical protein